MRRITRKTIVAGVALAALATAVGAQQNFEPKQNRECSDGTIQGAYGIQISGTRPAPNGQMESVVGVVVREYDGFGRFTQVGNVKGSVTGFAPNQPGFGTYQVNGNCSATTSLFPGNGIQIVEEFVIVDDGNEIRSIASSPPPLMVSGIHKRIDSH